jgi:hypothetical protein
VPLARRIVPEKTAFVVSHPHNPDIVAAAHAALARLAPHGHGPSHTATVGPHSGRMTPQPVSRAFLLPDRAERSATRADRALWTVQGDTRQRPALPDPSRGPRGLREYHSLDRGSQPPGSLRSAGTSRTRCHLCQLQGRLDRTEPVLGEASMSAQLAQLPTCWPNPQVHSLKELAIPISQQTAITKVRSQPPNHSHTMQASLLRADGCRLPAGTTHALPQARCGRSCCMHGWPTCVSCVLGRMYIIQFIA